MITLRHDVHTVRRRAIRYLVCSGCLLLVSVGTRLTSQAADRDVVRRPGAGWTEYLQQWQEP